MKVSLIWIGKTQDKYLEQGIEKYIKRLKKYCNFQLIEIKGIKKNISEKELKQLEGEKLLQVFDNYNKIILLDERGKNLDSVTFADHIKKWQLHAVSSCCFVIGGAYGFSDAVYKRSDFKLSLSDMTFSHQMVRLIALEQLYRAYTIIKGEPYHHP